MFKLFKAIGRYFRALMYTLVGDLSKWSEGVESNASYIKAEYDDIKDEQVKTIRETTDAVASLMELKAQKEARLEQLTEEIESLRRQLDDAVKPILRCHRRRRRQGRIARLRCHVRAHLASRSRRTCAMLFSPMYQSSGWTSR